MINLVCPTNEMVMLALKVRGDIANLDYIHKTTASLIDSDVNYWATGQIVFKDSEPFVILSKNIRELALLIGGDIYKLFLEEKEKVGDEIFLKMKDKLGDALHDLITIDDILEDLDRLKYKDEKLVIKNPGAFNSLLNNTKSLIRSIL